MTTDYAALIKDRMKARKEALENAEAEAKLKVIGRNALCVKIMQPITEMLRQLQQQGMATDLVVSTEAPWRLIRIQPGGEYADYSITLEVFNPEQEQILLRVYNLKQADQTRTWVSTVDNIEPFLLDILADILAKIWKPEKLFE